MSVIRCGYTERLERVLPSAADELKRVLLNEVEQLRIDISSAAK